MSTYSRWPYLVHSQLKHFDINRSIVFNQNKSYDKLMAVNDIKTIKELLEIIKHKIGMIEMRQSTQSGQIILTKDQQSVMNEKLDAIGKDLSEVKETQEDHTKRLEALSGDMEQVLSEVKSTHDEIGLWHQRDKREIDEIKRHIGLPLMPDIPTV